MSSETQKQLYGIAIFEQEIVMSDFMSGTEKRFIVSAEQLNNFFRSEVIFRPFPGLVWMKSTGDGETYLVTLPAGPRTILYRQTIKVKGKKAKQDLIDFKLTVPAIAVQAKIDTASRKIQSIQMWGFAGKLDEKTVLYELPLPNLSRSSLCLGSTERSAIGGDVLGAIERTIFDTPFNHHNHIVSAGKIPFEAYMTKYKGRCPIRTMNKIGTGKDILGGAR
jgi:hypothetical protein